MRAKYQIYKDVAGRFRFRLRAENNKIVAVSEAYEQHASCINGVQSIQQNCNAEIEDLTAGGEKILNPKYQIFYDKSCGYRFHLNAKNGEIIAASEGYETKEGCLNGINAVKNSCNAEIQDLTTTQKPQQETLEAQPSTAAVMVETLELVVTPKLVPAEVAMAPVSGMVETKLELYVPERAAKGDTVTFQGKLTRNDTGKGIPCAKIDIFEQDRSFLSDDYLAYGDTNEDGTFSIDWKARQLDFWDDTGEIYARFKGNENANPSKTSIKKIIIK
jgi:hypothetical protein